MTLELRASRDRIDAERERIRLILQNAYDAFIGDRPGRPHHRLERPGLQAVRLARRGSDRPRCDRAAGAARAARRAARLPAAFRAQRRMRDAGRPDRGDWCWTATATRLPVEIAVTALPTPQGHGVTAFVRDIRPRKAAGGTRAPAPAAPGGSARRAAALAEAGSGRPADGRRRARLQQHPAHHQRQRPAHAAQRGSQPQAPAQHHGRGRTRQASWPPSCSRSRAASRCTRAWSAWPS